MRTNKLLLSTGVLKSWYVFTVTVKLFVIFCEFLAAYTNNQLITNWWAIVLLWFSELVLFVFFMIFFSISINLGAQFIVQLVLCACIFLFLWMASYFCGWSVAFAIKHARTIIQSSNLREHLFVIRFTSFLSLQHKIVVGG